MQTVKKYGGVTIPKPPTVEARKAHESNMNLLSIRKHR